MRIDTAASFNSMIRAAGGTVPKGAETAVAIYESLGAIREQSIDLRAELRAGKITPKTAPERMAEAQRVRRNAEDAKAIAPDMVLYLGEWYTEIVLVHADALVAEIAPRFASTIDKLVTAAQVVPIEADATWAVDNAGNDGINAYNALRGIRIQLDAVEQFRVTLSRQFDYDSGDRIAAMFLADVTDFTSLIRASGILNGTVAYNAPNARVTPQERVEPAGGPWHHLIAEGYKLRLNNAAEAEAILAKARAAEARTPAQFGRVFVG